MTNKFQPNGIGGSTGDSLALAKPLNGSGDIWYVHYATGTDAASPAGQNREKPLKTLAQAHTNATNANGDIIVLMDGHAETIASTLTLSKNGLCIVGEGSNAGLPTVQLTNNQAAAAMIVVGADGIQFRNIMFMENAQACATARVDVQSTLTSFRGCYFRCGAHDTGPAVLLDTSCTNARFRSCTWISTSTSTQPESGLKAGAGTVFSGLTLEDCIFSAGTVGFSNFYALDMSPATTNTNFKIENLSLLLGADVKFAAAHTGYINVATATGGSKVVW